MHVLSAPRATEAQSSKRGKGGRGAHGVGMMFGAELRGWHRVVQALFVCGPCRGGPRPTCQPTSWCSQTRCYGLKKGYFLISETAENVVWLVKGNTTVFMDG
ncbi:hypothetical protein VNO80_10150 [Phaseolus coccineus]|uniref:Uncharacterized protein n=1 Tax=Phaseolus coccineus TaxID=3886 RepID=A0AAN9NCW2_PHACN